MKLSGVVREIDAELSEEEARKSRLAELESALAQLSTARAAQEIDSGKYQEECGIAG